MSCSQTWSEGWGTGGARLGADASPCVSGREQGRAGQQAHPTPGPLTGGGPATPLSAPGVQTRGGKRTEELTGECGKVQKRDLFSCTEAVGRSPSLRPVCLLSWWILFPLLLLQPALPHPCSGALAVRVSLSLCFSLSLPGWDVTLFLPFFPLHLPLGSLGLSVWGSRLIMGPTLSLMCSLQPCAGVPAPPSKLAVVPSPAGKGLPCPGHP